MGAGHEVFRKNVASSLVPPVGSIVCSRAFMAKKVTAVCFDLDEPQHEERLVARIELENDTIEDREEHQRLTAELRAAGWSSSGHVEAVPTNSGPLVQFVPGE